MKRIVPVFLILVIIFITSWPQSKVHAIAPVIAGVGAEVAIGAYVLGAFAIAEGAGMLGYTVYEDRVNEYARNAWIDANSAIKQSMYDSYNYAILSGSKTIDLSTDVINFIKSKITPAVMHTLVVSNVSGAGIMTVYGSGASYKEYYIRASSGYVFLINGVVTYALSIGDNTANYHYYTTDSYNSGQLAGRIWSGNVVQTFDAAWSAGLSYFGSMSFISSADYNAINTATSTLQSNVPNKIATVPYDNLIPYFKDGYGVLDKTKRLVYNPATDVFKDSLGNTVSKDKVGYGTPTIGINTDAGTGTKTITADISGVNTNVLTGAATGTGTAPVNPPLDWTPPTTSSLDFSPLLMLGAAFTTKFPFSIPWDLQKQLGIFNITPTAPSFNLSFTVMGTHVDAPMNFAQFDVFAAIARWALVIVFDIAMIMGIRRLIPS